MEVIWLLNKFLSDCRRYSPTKLWDGAQMATFYGRPIVGQTIIFSCCDLFFFSSPNVSGRRLDVYHSSTHGVALV